MSEGIIGEVIARIVVMRSRVESFLELDASPAQCCSEAQVLGPFYLTVQGG